MATTVSWWEGEELKELVYEDVKGFKDRLKLLRKGKRLSVDELSDQIRWNRDCIVRWEGPDLLDVPGLRTLEQLCDFFNVSKDYLMNGSKENIEQLSLF